jgi:hypothetical protein
MLSQIKNILKKLEDYAVDVLSPIPTPEEAHRIEMLRETIRRLPPLPEKTGSEAGDEWNRNRMKLRRYITTRDPRNFLRWDMVRYTMFHESKIEEFNYLKNSPHWPYYKRALEENWIGRPRHYIHHLRTSGNLVHHTYSFAQLKEKFGIEPEKFSSVVEFGGGYGSFARLMYQLGFKGHYIIFDLPEFLFLQRFFLNSIPKLGLKTSVNYRTNTERSVSLVQNVEECTQALNGSTPDLFVATWSLSETPLPIRDEVLKAIGAPQYFLIAYQEKFNEINNITYFEAFTKKRPEYTWITYPITHLKGSFYLLGKKNG